MREQLNLLTRSDCVRTRNNTNTISTQQDQTKNNEYQVKRWLPRYEWNKMLLERRRNHLNKFHRSNSSYNIDVPRENQLIPLPSQYSMASSAMTKKESNLYNFMTTIDTQ